MGKKIVCYLMRLFLTVLLVASVPSDIINIALALATLLATIAGSYITYKSHREAKQGR